MRKAIRYFPEQRWHMLHSFCSVFAVVCYMLCYMLTTERVKVEQKTEKFNLRDLLSGLAHNRPLIGIILSSICMLLAQLTLSGMAAYIYPNYFRNVRAQSAAGLVGTVITLVCSLFTVKLSQKFGRKELGIASALLSAAVLIFTFSFIRIMPGFSLGFLHVPISVLVSFL